jgi:hypothetical protein
MLATITINHKNWLKVLEIFSNNNWNNNDITNEISKIHIPNQFNLIPITISTKKFQFWTYCPEYIGYNYGIILFKCDFNDLYVDDGSCPDVWFENIYDIEPEQDIDTYNSFESKFNDNDVETFKLSNYITKENFFKQLLNDYAIGNQCLAVKKITNICAVWSIVISDNLNNFKNPKYTHDENYHVITNVIKLNNGLKK